MSDTKIQEQIKAIEDSMREQRGELKELRSQLTGTVVSDYNFTNGSGDSVSLSSLFQGGDELMLIHNMGKSCPYCTLWADEFNGIADHLASRVPFVVVSPDSPTDMTEFAESRNWRFSMLSSEGNTFKKDMGFENEEGRAMPGVSIFTMKNGEIYHHTSAPFGPGDNYCSHWDFIDMLPSGHQNWHPKYNY